MTAKMTAETTPLQWNAEALWLQLEPLLPGLSVEVLASTASTNSTLLQRARGAAGQEEGADLDSPFALRRRSRESRAFDAPAQTAAADPSPSLLVAEQQTAGRGRLGRAWQSQPGASLTFSLSLPFEPADWSGLALADGVTLADALDPLDETGEGGAGSLRKRIGLKWPNDLWLLDAAGDAVGRKLGGILIETVAARAGAAGEFAARRVAVIGTGLNVLPFEAGSVGTGLAFLHELDAAISAPAILARVAEPLLRALLRFERDGFAPFAARFAARDLLFGRPVQAGAEHGVAEGVTPTGALRVRSADGALREVVGGEVSVRLAAAPTTAQATLPPAGAEPSA